MNGASLPTARGRKTILWIVLSMPLLWLAALVIQELRQPNSGLGPEPTEALLHYLGEWSLILVLLAFSVSPLRRRLGWAWLGQHRRFVGLFAFAYVCLHVLVYAGLYAQFQLTEVLDDFVHRPYITAGIGAFVALSLMALTSTRGWRWRLKENWQRLHRLIYVASFLALVHLLWLRKDPGLAEAIYLAIFVVLMVERMFSLWRRRRST